MIALARTLQHNVEMATVKWQEGASLLCFQSSEETSSLSSLSMMLTAGLFPCLYQVEKFPFYSRFAGSLYNERQRHFFCVYRDDQVVSLVDYVVHFQVNLFFPNF